MNNTSLLIPDLQNLIFTIRGVPVMLDSDLAELYDVETRILNQAVKRNLDRFPDNFRFQLTEIETQNLISQIVISSSKHGGIRKLPYVFTEQGVSMLSAVLRSNTAVQVSIKIINVFVKMRIFISQNANLFQRINNIEQKQIASDIKQQQTDNKIDTILDAIESKEVKHKQGIFYDGQIFDAYKLVSKIIRSAKHSIILIDNYIDETVLTHFEKRNKKVALTILTKNPSEQLKLDVEKFNKQYPKIILKEFNKSHDRFLIIDNKTIYHLGASLKDLGKKWFAFSKMEISAIKMLKEAGEIVTG